jgi:hypothetical protein
MLKLFIHTLYCSGFDIYKIATKLDLTAETIQQRCADFCCSEKDKINDCFIFKKKKCNEYTLEYQKQVWMIFCYLRHYAIGSSECVKINFSTFYKTLANTWVPIAKGCIPIFSEHLFKQCANTLVANTQISKSSLAPNHICVPLCLSYTSEDFECVKYTITKKKTIFTKYNEHDYEEFFGKSLTKEKMIFIKNNPNTNKFYKEIWLCACYIRTYASFTESERRVIEIICDRNNEFLGPLFILYKRIYCSVKKIQQKCIKYITQTYTPYLYLSPDLLSELFRCILSKDPELLIQNVQNMRKLSNAQNNNKSFQISEFFENIVVKCKDADAETKLYVRQRMSAF